MFRDRCNFDGAVGGHGDPGRAARYNSALRYQLAAAAPTVVMIVSEDGDATWLPALRPRVPRQQIADALHRAARSAAFRSCPQTPAGAAGDRTLAGPSTTLSARWADVSYHVLAEMLPIHPMIAEFYPTILGRLKSLDCIPAVT